jgi:signal transduction histidine kinase
VAGKIRLDRHRVDVAAIASAAVDAARPAARAKRITLTETIAPLLFVDGDPHRLQQVIFNLLTNALKFTPDHGQIHLALTRDDACARLVVRDTGIGIAADVLPRIFERFAQGNVAVPSRTSGGLSLGLAIVKYFVEQHGGAITADSAGPGHGATFTVTLPFSAEAAAATIAAPAAERIDRSLLSGVRVLVVDDTSDDRATLGAILEHFGATPTMVGSACRSRPGDRTGRP